MKGVYRICRLGLGLAVILASGVLQSSGFAQLPAPPRSDGPAFGHSTAPDFETSLEDDSVEPFVTQTEEAVEEPVVPPVPDLAASAPYLNPPPQQQQQQRAPAVSYGRCPPSDCFRLQLAPAGLLYKAYLAGEKEPRISSAWLAPRQGNIVWENTLGGRVGVIRYGNSNPLRPQGFQFDLEGAVMARVDPQADSAPLIASDYRIGLLGTWRVEDTAIKAGYYHLSSHVGDEYLINNPGFDRLNYVRDSLIVGVTEYFADDDWSVYGEFAYAFNAEDGAEPIELQYGVQWAPMVTGWPGTPYAAINGHTREDFGWITSVNVMAGWLWRSKYTNRTLRVGMQYYDGPSMQWEFVNQHESLLGGGIWFDY